MHYKKLLMGLVVLATCFGCARFAIMSAPKKSMTIERTHDAIAADEFFWRHFHAGDFDKIDEILFRLKAAFLKDPNDWQTASHLGFTHAWRLSEHKRLPTLLPTTPDDAVLAQWYFDEAVKLNRNDPRIKGFAADFKIVTGSIYHDERKIREGYFQGLDAIREWPEFNYFTLGYVMSTKPATDERFKEGLAWQWKTLDLCSGTTVDRKNPDYAPFMALEETGKQQRKKSACWNSWIAPHNFEGFFLNMGDMLMKAGDTNTAITIYANAKLSKTYEQWPYKKVLDERITAARQAKPGAPEKFAPAVMMVDSTFSCMACHQAR